MPRMWRDIFPKILAQLEGAGALTITVTDAEVVVSKPPQTAGTGWSGSGGCIRAGHAVAVFDPQLSGCIEWPLPETRMAGFGKRDWP